MCPYFFAPRENLTWRAGPVSVFSETRDATLDQNKPVSVDGQRVPVKVKRGHCWVEVSIGGKFLLKKVTLIQEWNLASKVMLALHFAPLFAPPIWLPLVQFGPRNFVVIVVKKIVWN